jgi:hypothetical protein
MQLQVELQLVVLLVEQQQEQKVLLVPLEPMVEQKLQVQLELLVVLEH